ncbi:MAG: 3-isopropylmalate dehydratase small subunit [Anaerolineae bacterium]|nr:3-isopropylmalate dehydratase small subunit [Anaerolineae bacterium]
MQSFTTLTSTFIPVPFNDVDTDQIIPAEYLKVTSKDGLVEGLFQRWRYRPDGTPDPAFPLNQPEYQGAQILLAGDNFGCGSSREHAPWALQGWGFKAIISTSFADIFRNNALKNGLLPVAVDAETHEQLLEMSTESPQLQLTIDLATQMVTLPGGRTTTFPIDHFSKTCLLEGLDQLGYLLKQAERIAEYEQAMGK